MSIRASRWFARSRSRHRSRTYARLSACVSITQVTNGLLVPCGRMDSVSACVFDMAKPCLLCGVALFPFELLRQRTEVSHDGGSHTHRCKLSVPFTG